MEPRGDAPPAPDPFLVAAPAGANDGGAAPPPRSPRLAAAASVDRIALSRFLEAPARTAMQRRAYPRAIGLFRGLVAARGPGDPVALDLARAWTLAGRYDEAAEVLDTFVASSEDRALIDRARSERDRVARARFFFDQRFEVPAATPEARRCFELGRAAYRRGDFGEALAYYEIGYVLDPEMPGFLRELGATYDRLGASQERLTFYSKYLQLRPLGKNADFVRGQLQQRGAPLGVLDVSSSLPCDEFWLSGTTGVKLPLKQLVLPPGRFKALCVNFAHELAYFEYVTVEAKKTTSLLFRWALIENRLTQPLGRIRIEDPRSGDLVDLGVSAEAVGVVVPEDNRALRLELVAEDGTRRTSRYLRVTPGRRYTVRW